MSDSSPSPPAAPSIDELLQRGLELHQGGRPGEGAAFYRRVLETDADNATANHLLGLVLLGNRDAEQAVAHLARAVAAKPGDARILTNLGVALNAVSRDEKAAGVLRRAIEIDPGFAEAHSNLGMVLRSLGELDEAVECYRRAVELKPDHAGFHYNLGNAWREAQDYRSAELSYRRALELRPNHPGAANGLAGLLGERFRDAEGLQILEGALRASPANAQLHVRRGRLLRRLGRLDEAVGAYDAAIRLSPGSGEALHHRTTLLPPTGRDAGLLALERLFANAGAAVGDRVFAGFGLGRALAHIGEHRASVETFLAVNRMHRERIEFSLEAATAQLLATTIRGDAPPFEAIDAPSAVRPVFVVGLSRAGKSTVEAVLARHPEVVPLGEVTSFARLYGQLAQRHGEAPLADLPSGEIRQLGHDYLREIEWLAGRTGTTVDTLPSNHRLVAAIRAALPMARIVWCRRSAVEHCLAIFEKFLPAPGNEYAFDLDELLPFHAAYRSVMARWDSEAPDAFLRFDVAALAADREAAVRQLLSYCALEWDDRCLSEVESEPTLDRRDAAARAASRQGHLDAWRAIRPGLFAAES